MHVAPVAYAFCHFQWHRHVPVPNDPNARWRLAIASSSMNASTNMHRLCNMLQWLRRRTPDSPLAPSSNMETKSWGVQCTAQRYFSLLFKRLWNFQTKKWRYQPLQAQINWISKDDSFRKWSKIHGFKRLVCIQIHSLNSLVTHISRSTTIAVNDLALRPPQISHAFKLWFLCRSTNCSSLSPGHLMGINVSSTAPQMDGRSAIWQK